MAIPADLYGRYFHKGEKKRDHVSNYRKKYGTGACGKRNSSKTGIQVSIARSQLTWKTGCDHPFEETGYFRQRLLLA